VPLFECKKEKKKIINVPFKVGFKSARTNKMGQGNYNLFLERLLEYK
jgi:hypothetical protein